MVVSTRHLTIRLGALFDSLLLLKTGGQCVYFGPIGPQGLDLQVVPLPSTHARGALPMMEHAAHGATFCERALEAPKGNCREGALSLSKAVRSCGLTNSRS